MNFMIRTFIGAVLFGAVLPAQAVLINNGAPDQISGVAVANSKIGADDFRLTRALLSIQRGSFYTLEEAGAWDGGFTVSFYDDHGGNPGPGVGASTNPSDAPLVSLSNSAGEVAITRTVVQTGIDIGPPGSPIFSNLTEYLYEFELLAPVELTEGHYWMTLYLQDDAACNADPNCVTGSVDAQGNPMPEIFWETTGVQNYYAASQSSGIPAPYLWNPVFHPNGTTDVAFTLEYDVLIPLPGSLLLMLPGLLVIMMRREKRKA